LVKKNGPKFLKYLRKKVKFKLEKDFVMFLIQNYPKTVGIPFKKKYFCLEPVNININGLAWLKFLYFQARLITRYGENLDP
jgi:hypothetical protein